MYKYIFIALTFLFFCPVKVLSQNSFENHLKNSWGPISGFQLPDSTYRIITNGKLHAPAVLRMETHQLDKSGKQIQHIEMGVPNCFDNRIYQATFDKESGVTYINGTTNGCYPYVNFLFAINANADSIKYIEYDTANGFGSLVANQTGLYYSKVYNWQVSPKDSLPIPIVHYDNISNSKILITDSNVTTYGRYYPNCVIPSGVILLDLFEYAICKYNIGTKALKKIKWATFDSACKSITSIQITSAQDIIVLYRKFTPIDSQWTDALALLDSNLNVKWVHTIPNTTAKIQTAYPYKTQCVVRPNNTFLVIKHKDTEQFISRTLFLHNIDINGNLIKVDSLQLRPPEESFGITMVLKSAVTTFDNGLFLTMTSHGHGHPDYSRFTYVIKTDSNLQLPHRLNTSTGPDLDNTLLHIYPNPNSTNTLHINFPERVSFSDNIEIAFYNAMGQQVKILKGSPEELKEINIGQLPQGCYVVEARSGSNTVYRTRLLRDGGR